MTFLPRAMSIQLRIKKQSTILPLRSCQHQAQVSIFATCVILDLLNTQGFLLLVFERFLSALKYWTIIKSSIL